MDIIIKDMTKISGVSLRVRRGPASDWYLNIEVMTGKMIPADIIFLISEGFEFDIPHLEYKVEKISFDTSSSFVSIEFSHQTDEDIQKTRLFGDVGFFSHSFSIQVPKTKVETIFINHLVPANPTKYVEIDLSDQKAEE